MREPTLRPSPGSPPSAAPARSRKPRKAVEPTPVETASPVPSINPIAPGTAALEAYEGHPVESLRGLRPRANQKAVWNKRAGRPDSRPDSRTPYDTIAPFDDSLAERLITTQAPQRPLSTPTFRLSVDGRVVEGIEGQTILEVCRANGIEVPTLCYEPKLPGFGACRMCVVEVEGEEHPPISCSRAAEAGMVVRTQTEGLRRLRRTNLELIFSDHNAY